MPVCADRPIVADTPACPCTKATSLRTALLSNDAGPRNANAGRVIVEAEVAVLTLLS